MIFKNNIDSKTFCKEVEKLSEERKLSLIDSIFFLADKMEINEDRIPSLISGHLKDKLQVEGENLNLLKKQGNKLPI